jgi:8-oxo-dGTP pyrophosphatase MutT (NUDIX family)
MEIEYWDVYDENRVKTGRIHRRGEPPLPGDYHIIVNVWIKNSHGLYLISKRAPEKSWPGFWECTGGCVITGDSSLQAAMREAREELGLELDPSKGRLMYQHRIDDFFRDVWLFHHDIDIGCIVFQEGETCDAKWAAPSEIRKMKADGTFLPVTDYLEQLFKDVE